VLNDDFAYLRSVVETLQRGRPWTDEWLEPWSAGLSLAAASIFKLTGSFYAATYGLMAVSATWAFAAGCELLHRRGLGALRSVLVTAGALALPTIFWKQVQFTGLVLYLPCLLTALWAADTRRWGLFLAVWIVAFATRQSALLWGVLPLFALVAELKKGCSGQNERYKLAVVLAAGVGAFGLVALTMNKTAAQAAITDSMWAQWSLAQAARATCIAAVAFLLFRGLAIGVSGNFNFPTTRGSWAWRIAVGVLLAGGWLMAGPRQFVGCEFENYHGWPGAVYWGAGGVLAFLALAGGTARVNWGACIAASAATASLTLRPVIWDYYLLDVAVFGAWSIPACSTPEISPAWWRRVWLFIAIVTFGAFHAWSVVQTKSVLDRTRVMTELGARAVETGELDPADASILPFGLMAWYFFPYYVTHEGKGSANLADFGCYLNHDTVLVAWRFSRSLRKLPGHDGGIPGEPTGRPIIFGRFRYFWIYDVDVLMYRNFPAKVVPARTPYPRNYRLPRFPLSDAGWRELVDSGSVVY
jgi:hypothetical protein